MLRFIKTGEIHLLILLTVGHCVRVHTQYSFQLALNDRCLHGHDFRSLNVNGPADCFLACVEDCLCLAFQIYDCTICQLLSTTQLIKPSSLMWRPGWHYYDVTREGNSKQSNLCQTGWSCSCHQSNPCLNGGTCEPAVSATSTERFQCKCSPGYSGNLCQDPVKSCRGYVNGSRVPGKYKVFDANMNLFEVFCDFDTHSTMAWTLIQSYQLQLKAQCSFTLSLDHPVNENSPVWDSYRLSKSSMQSIQEDSSKWRMTCRYDTDGLNYTDYVRGSNYKRNILTYDGLECQEVEFIDIRGYSCTDCTAGGAQRPSAVWHFDSLNSYLYCSFKPMNSLSCGGSPGEDNFGFYYCQNSAHRCSSSPTSTSQTWFGNE